MSPAQKRRVPLIYIRLSIEEMDDTKEPTEIKLQKRKQIAIGLALQYELEVADVDIYIERESGVTIERRREFSEVLRRCRTGEVSHLITPYQDRTLRGSKRDEAEVEEALKLGRVILVSTEGAMDFGDPDFDTAHGLSFTVRNMISRQYIFDLAKKQREANKIKIRRGECVSGKAPYGYEWVKPVYEHRRLITPGHYITIPEEYALICEFFERVRFEAVNKIARDWNRRYQETGQPDPTKCEWRPAKAWYPKTLREILLNPFYAGYPAHRHRVVVHGQTRERMAKSEWVLADEEQDYPHPVTLAEMEELQHIVNERQKKGEAKPACNTILSGGILYCSQDECMRGNQHDYSCRCAEYGKKHQTKAVSKPRIHHVAQVLMRDCTQALPDILLNSSGPGNTDRRDLHTQYNSVRKRLKEEEQKTKDLMEYASMQIRIYGPEKYEQVCEENKRTVDMLQQQVLRLEEELQQPDINDIRPVLQQLRDYGFDAFWEEASPEVLRAIIPYFIAKIKLVAPGQGHRECKLVEVTLTDLALHYLPPDYPYRTHPFPLQGRIGGSLTKGLPLTKTGKRVHRKLPD